MLLYLELIICFLKLSFTTSLNISALNTESLESDEEFKSIPVNWR